MKIRFLFAFMFCVATFALCGTVQAWQPGQPNEKYQLQKVVILSRHNIRSPLTSREGILDKVTPHEWFRWTSAPSELSVRGGQLETIMGQFFRKWLVSEKFMDENYVPESGEFLFYANAMQRTIATAQYFSSGMLPIANVRIQHGKNLGHSDEVFGMKLHFDGKNYKKIVKHQFSQLGGDVISNGKDKEFASSMATLEKVLDFQQSEMAEEQREKLKTAADVNVLPKKPGINFNTKSFKIKLEKGHGASMKGGISTAVQAADALILQYYEEPDHKKAAFGHDVSFNEWQSIGRISNHYGRMLIRTPAVAINIANPLIKKIANELDAKKRKFTFLCGHDSNISAVLAAINAEPFSLPGAIETATPIGGKLMITKWLGQDGNEYASIDMVYQNVSQLNDVTMLSLENPPAIYPVVLPSLPVNEDGFYNYQDVRNRFKEAMESYAQLKAIAK